MLKRIKDVTENQFSEVDFHRDLQDGFAARLIRRKVMQLTSKLGTQDADDLEQSFYLHLLRNWSKFDPSLGHWNVFAKTLIERHAASILRQRRTKKATFHQSLASLDTRAADSCTESPSLGDCVETDRRAAHVGFYGQSDLDRSKQKMDVDSVVSRLTADEQMLCKELMESTPSEVARRRRVPRTNLRREIAKMKTFFKK